MSTTEKKSPYLENLLSNMFGIFNFVQSPENLWGVSEVVLFETLTSVFFYSMFLPQYYPGLRNIVLTHLISLPFLSAIPIASFGDKVNLKKYLEEKMNFKTAVQLSTQGIPAVLLSQYIVGTFNYGGIHLPKIMFSDLLVTAGSKLITRPLLQMIYALFLGGVPKVIRKFESNLLKQSDSLFGDFLRFFDSDTNPNSNKLLEMAQTFHSQSL